MDESIRFRTAKEGDVTIVEFADRQILDEAVIAEISQDLAEMAEKEPNPLMVLDFRNLTHMSSSALGMLITLHKLIKSRQGHLRLCGIRPEIFEVFEIMKLTNMFDIHSDRIAALLSLP
jgi:anti-sigma B factor antagonist